MRIFITTMFLILYFAGAEAQVYKDRNASVEDRVASILSFMTFDEKISYIGGVDGFYIRDIPRLGLPKIKMSDGPVGVRTWGQTTAYPAGICNAATWDKDLIYSLGQALGKDARVIDAVTNSDAAVVCAGFNSSTESEGFDRPFSLGAAQDSLICRVARANPKTVVIINAGGNVDMQNWLTKVKGVLYAWYPGQNGGKAVAEILFGKTCPGGKLPVTFEKKWNDNPVFGNYYANNGSTNIKYNEGIFVGYRYYEENHIEPQFPFGFGLSYTTFKYSNLSIASDYSDTVVVSFDIKNTGSVAGAEVAELYVNQNVPKVPRPVKELKDFGKVFLQPGETKTVTLKLDANTFSYYSTARSSFVVDSGRYDIIIGSSSVDERLRQTFLFQKNLIIGIEKNQFTPENEFTIYPVPADDHIVIQMFNNDLRSRDLEVFNATGRLVDKIRFTDSSYIYDCSRLPDGLYICRIISDKISYTGKFIVGH
jgi:hypothetical protein